VGIGEGDHAASHSVAGVIFAHPGGAEGRSDAGVPDQPVEVTTDDLRGHTSYRSLSWMAGQTTQEGNAPLHRARYTPREFGAALFAGDSPRGVNAPAGTGLAEEASPPPLHRLRRRA
jgi:hypothetical protein